MILELSRDLALQAQLLIESVQGTTSAMLIYAISDVDVVSIQNFWIPGRSAFVSLSSGNFSVAIPVEEVRVRDLEALEL